MSNSPTNKPADAVASIIFALEAAYGEDALLIATGQREAATGDMENTWTEIVRRLEVQ